MSIQYAGGTIINATLTQSTGTRAELAQWIRDQLINAGWTSSGSATDYQLTSATTPGGSLTGRVRVYDPGSGNCAKLKFSNTTGLKTQTGDLFLLPAVGKVWRIIANKFQFFVMTAGASPAREFACGGVPYLPTFLQGVITECLWGQGNAVNDTDTTTYITFRSGLSSGWNSGAQQGNGYHLCNGNQWEYNGGTEQAGTLQLNVPSSSVLQNTNSNNYRWHDDSLVVAEPLIGWGLTASTIEAKIRGQLWDSVFISDSFAGDTTITLDSRTYYAITNSNSGVANGVIKGTLFVAVS